MRRPQPPLDARGLGTLVHAVLAEIDFARPGDVADAGAASCRGATAGDRATACRRAVELVAPVPGFAACGRDWPRPRKCYRELEFLLAWPPGDDSATDAISQGLHRLPVPRCGRPVAGGRLQDQSRDGRDAGRGGRRVRDADARVRPGRRADSEQRPPASWRFCFLRPGLEYRFAWDAAARQRVVELVEQALGTMSSEATCGIAVPSRLDLSLMLVTRSQSLMPALARHRSMLMPEEQRRFAVEVVRRLRGGGVRGLLGRRLRPRSTARPHAQGLRRGHQCRAGAGPRRCSAAAARWPSARPSA